MPFSVGRNSKPMHHVWCSLLGSEHSLLQSASVPFLPRWPLPSSWLANRWSKSWSDTRKQRAGFGEGDGEAAAAGEATACREQSS